MIDFNKDDALAANAWPFVEAEKILEKIGRKTPSKGYVLFETGYGPSGLPHIGTFMEVFRTSLVRRAFERLAPDIPTRLIAVSDDMDGLRKVPDNIPNQEMVAEHLYKPLTQVPDPFGTHESYGAHMNAKLCGFLDQYGFEYEFISSTENYQKGAYDEALLKALERYDAIMKVMLPTLGEERQKTYSPFLPICPDTGHVLQVPAIDRNVEKGTLTFEREGGSTFETPVTGGHCKLQWKPDFGMRWAALDVDFEMYGKDHQDSAPLYNSICKILEGNGPHQYVYEMFLDAEGKKISKSKGNGISIEEWLRYGTKDSLAYYMYQNPRKAKRLHFDVIPKAVDELYTFASKLAEAEGPKIYQNPTWHLFNGEVPGFQPPVSFGLLLNLAAACNPEDASVLWGFISKYAQGATAETMPEMAELVDCALAYYEDFVKPNKHYRAADAKEQAAMEDLLSRLKDTDATSAEDLQTLVYDVGNAHEFENLRDWFKALYEVLLGQSQGPRMGSFIALYGKDETISLLEQGLSGSLANAA